jgi:hypothetical protein
MDDRRKTLEAELVVLQGFVSKFRAGELAEIEGGRCVDKSRSTSGGEDSRCLRGSWKRRRPSFSGGGYLTQARRARSEAAEGLSGLSCG